MTDLRAGRMRTPDPSSEAFRRARPTSGGPSVQSGATKREEALGHESRAGSDEPTLAGLRARHPTLRVPVAFPERALDAVDVPADDMQTRLAELTH